jgi:DhnA family fructose-bisphosphate aldolase class Ia
MAPPQGLALEYVHGFNGDANGRNIFSIKDPNTGAPLLVWAVAAVVVIHDPATKKQRYFMGHSEQVVALTVDASCTLAASAQCATVVKGRSKPPLVFVWDLETLEVRPSRSNNI